MKLSTITTLFALTIPAFTVPTGGDAASSGEVVPMHITLPTADGPLELIGTYEDLIPQIQEIYPDWDPYPEVADQKPTPTSSPNPSLVERYFKNRPTCWLVRGNSCWTWAVGQARNNLKNLPAGTMCGGPPNLCSRTTCADGAALDLCNDRTTSLSILCSRVDHASGEIAHDCQDNFDGETWTKGQWFDTTGYNVVVRRCY